MPEGQLRHRPHHFAGEGVGRHQHPRRGRVLSPEPQQRPAPVRSNGPPQGQRSSRTQALRQRVCRNIGRQHHPFDPLPQQLLSGAAEFPPFRGGRHPLSPAHVRAEKTDVQNIDFPEWNGTQKTPLLIPAQQSDHKIILLPHGMGQEDLSERLISFSAR